MLSVMFVKLLTLIFFLTKDVHHTCAETKLAAPQKVKVNSINMGAVVEWSSPRKPRSNLTYTARYILRNNATVICENTKELKCDAGALKYVYGSYIFQVRAEAHGVVSEWVNASTFMPNKHSIIGLPTVHLVIQNNILDVHVQAPKLKAKILPEVIKQMTYIIKYWAEGFEDGSTEKKVTEANGKDFVILSVKGLHSWSRYCAQARVVINGFKNGDLFSAPVCVNNIPVLTSCMIAAAVLLPLLILSAWIIYKVYRFLYPKTKLPEHLKNLLVPTFWTAEATPHSPQQKEQHDKISAISEDHAYEALSEKSKISEEKDSGISCALGPIQEVEEDYKLLLNISPPPAFYPNHLYPLCFQDKLLNQLNQPCVGDCTNTQPRYYNITDSEQKHTDCVF